MNKYTFNPEQYKDQLIEIIHELLEHEDLNISTVDKILKRYPKDGNKIFRRDQIIAGIEWLTATPNELQQRLKTDNRQLITNIKMKPMRTESGVTTVTVLTKAFACPGKCIFCPNDVRMPKSYIATEPGAQRALANRFSPYLQTWNRLQAIKNIGHPTDKIELLVLGGTWSSYPERYQIWFVKELFRALNDFGEDNFTSEDQHTSVREYLLNDYNDKIREKLGEMSYNNLLRTEEFKKEFASKYIADEEGVTLSSVEGWEELEEIHAINAKSKCRCVGLVLETRSDMIHEREVLRLRKLGATKIQVGIQTLDDEVSKLNERGETKEQVAKAFRLLRSAGFKIHAHMMPNLYGATLEGDLEVYKELFESEDFKPDEVKIYPTSTIKYTKLHDYYEKGEYKPYETSDLINLIASMMEMTPEYCRLTRIIRDIPSTEIAAGNTTTNLREFVEWKLQEEKRKNPNIRAREIKNRKVKFEDLSLDIMEYDTSISKEYFLQFITKERLIAGFLRLSLPKSSSQLSVVSNPKLEDKQTENREPKTNNRFIPELSDCAIIREVHVYGPSLELKKDSEGQAQHLGLGTKLIEKAKEITKEKGFEKLAVISAIGTREYYEKRGFELDKYYQIAKL